MAGQVEWHGDEAVRAIRAEVLARIHRCCLLVWNHAKKSINTDGTGVRAAAGPRRNGRRRRKGSLVYGANPSRPGDPPHKQHGRLLNSLAWEVDKESLTGRVGTNLLSGLLLEIGTRLVAARPWLGRALRECRDQVRAILSAPMKGP